MIATIQAQTAPLYRSEKLAQFGSRPSQFERILEIAARVLDIVHDIMLVAQKIFRECQK